MATIKSIKEKAKRYDEIVEKAKNCLKDGTITNTAISYIETIFPELKESEDERIMKALYKMAKVPRKEIYEVEGITKEQALAWLERKGEQKSQGKLEDDVRRRSTIQVLEYARSLDTYNQYGKADIDKNIAWLEKQGGKTQGKTALEAINEEKVDNANKIEPRQEELTEFERAVKQVMEEAIECGDTHNLKADADMLLNLARKSAWSEEDEERIKNIISVLDVQACWDGATGKKGNPYQREIDWLKSLKDRVQPQNTWKPIDEQIKVLVEVIIFAANHESPHWNDYIFGILKNLTRQLKKLKVE